MVRYYPIKDDGVLIFFARVLESIKNGKRLPETEYTNLKVVAKGQRSVYSMFSRTDSTNSRDTMEEK
jgi:hypothetical protein